MKYLSIASLSAIAAVAAAQQTTQPPTPEASCAAKCDTADICCHADCYNVPCPSENMANDTTGCVAKCDQGDGSESDTEAYAKCANSCVSSLFWTNTGAPPVQTGTTTAQSSGASPTGGSDDGGDDSDGGSGGSGGSDGGDGGSDGGDDSEGGSGGGSGSEEGSEEGSEGSTTTEGAPDATDSPDAAAQLIPTGASIFGLVLAAFAL